MDRADLTRRARLGVVALVARTVVVQLTTLVGTVYLARSLDPGDFGVYAIVQFTLSCFMLLGDAGLAASLIQKPSEPSQRELSTVWWAQLAIALGVIGVVWVVAPFVLRLWPDTAPSTVWLLRALSLQLLFTSLRVIPALLLERELRFGRLSIVDFVATLSFYGTSVTLARLDLHVGALVGGVLAQGLAGAALILALRPWRPLLVFDRASLRPMLRFGLAFQGKTIAGFVNGAVTPLYAGAVLGKHPLGLNNFARDTAYFPLKLVEILARVSFPLYSRLHDDREAFVASLGRSVGLCAMGALFFVGLIFGIGPNLVSVIYSDKWLSALPALYVYTAAIGIGFLAPLIGSALDALGKPQIVFRLSVGWTLLNWLVVTLVMSRWRTTLAFALAYCVHVFVGNVAILFVLHRFVPGVRLWSRVRAAVVGAVVTAALGRGVLRAWASGPATLGASVLLAAGVFVGVVAILDRPALAAALAMLRGKAPAQGLAAGGTSAGHD